MEIWGKEKKQCCFSERVSTETSIPAYMSYPILFPKVIKARGGERSKFIYIFDNKDKNKQLEVCGGSLQLFEFLNTNGETVMHTFSFH